MKDRKDAIGFVFSGGGLQGIAHIGAVTALYELGIRPEYVSGTSSGSIMAMLVAMGLEPKNGEIISDVVKEVLASKGLENDFKSLPINLSVCTVDTMTTDECIFTTYDEHLEREHIHYLTDVPLDVAVRASMSFPAIYTTCPYKEYDFVDGGSKDNLPVRVLKDMGVGKVLAIGFDILQYKPDAGLDGLIKVIWRALDVYSIDSTRESMKLADLAVQIKNENTALFSIDSVDDTIQEGYDAIMAHKDEILKVFG